MHLLKLLRALAGGILIIGMVAFPKPVPQSIVKAQNVTEAGTSGTGLGVASFSANMQVNNLWVDAISGNNTNDGSSAATALRTIQHAADLAGPGTIIHIQPGVYRESVIPAQSGSASGQISYVAEAGPGTAVIRGSEPSSVLTWTPLTSNTIGLPPGVDPSGIYYADLSSWGLKGYPRFVMELDNQGEVVARLPLTREPDWPVVTDWKYHEFWWAADGGSDVAGCNPVLEPNCDSASRSLTQLTDRSNDAEPSGIEQGNLMTLGNLTGASLIVIDTNIGTNIYRRKIVAHDVGAGRITVDENAEQGYGSSQPALGWGSKYYVEDLPRLMDSPGEWWYDPSSGRLYLWPRLPGNPSNMNIEISRRDNGFVLVNRSYINLDGVNIEFFNENAVYLHNTEYDKAHSDTIRNARLRYSNTGVWLRQWVDPGTPRENAIDGFTIENSEIAYMDSRALYSVFSWPGRSAFSSADFVRPGILNTRILNNEMHHLGFNTDEDGVGALIAFPDHLRFEGNHIHDVAHVSVQFMRSVVQSSKKYGFSPEEIKTGSILIRDNIFEKACQNAIDCGAVKISGTPPDKHVFRDLLVTGNIIRNTFGWTYISEKRGAYHGGPSSAVQGMGGMGLYVDNASGIHAYRNIAYNNAFAGFKFAGAWRDGDMVFYNNISANSLNGFQYGGIEYDTHGNTNTQIVNNIIINNEGNGISITDADGNLNDIIIDHNLYYRNGWRSRDLGGYLEAGDLYIKTRAASSWYPTVSQIRAGTIWEDHGEEGNPGFWSYDINDVNLFDSSWPDMHLTNTSSNAIDQGTATLTDSLTALLNTFGIPDSRSGNAYDIGRYEIGFVILTNPSTLSVRPGGIARYTLSLYPYNLPFPVTLTAASSDPNITVSLEPAVITSGTTATLTVQSHHTVPKPIPGSWYSIRIQGTTSGVTSEATVRLLVGGTRIFLPAIRKE